MVVRRKVRGSSSSSTAPRSARGGRAAPASQVGRSDWSKGKGQQHIYNVHKSINESYQYFAARFSPWATRMTTLPTIPWSHCACSIPTILSEPSNPKSLLGSPRKRDKEKDAHLVRSSSFLESESGRDERLDLDNLEEGAELLELLAGANEETAKYSTSGERESSDVGRRVLGLGSESANAKISS